MIRLHVDAPLRAGARVEPSSDQARYLTGVMRLKLGDAVLLFNGRDGEWRASLAEMGRRGCVLIAEAQTRVQTGVPDLELVAALVKRGPLETIVEKAVELGCARVRLVTTRRTNADHVRLERLRTIMIEAAEQTGRLDVPEITAPEKLERVLDGWDASRRLMFCDEGEGFDALQAGVESASAKPFAVAPALDALRGAPRGSWAVLIGPEGGFHPSERERLRGLPFCTPVSLGPRILRADTAAISALTLWQAALGDWRA